MRVMRVMIYEPRVRRESVSISPGHWSGVKCIALITLQHLHNRGRALGTGHVNPGRMENRWAPHFALVCSKNWSQGRKSAWRRLIYVEPFHTNLATLRHKILWCPNVSRCIGHKSGLVSDMLWRWRRMIPECLWQMDHMGTSIDPIENNPHFSPPHSRLIQFCFVGPLCVVCYGVTGRWCEDCEVRC